MLVAYLKIAGRLILKHKRIHSLNVIGLSLGLTVALVLGAYCVNEYDFDSFNKNAPLIYRLWATIQLGANEGKTGQFSFQTADEIRRDPGVVDVVRIRKLGSAMVRNAGGFVNRESGIIFSGSSLFSVFTFPLMSCSAKGLRDPNTVLISQSMIARYFDDEDPIGKTLIYNDSITLKIEGTFSDVPENSTLKFDFVISENILPRLIRPLPGDSNFGPGSYETYVLLEKQADPKELSSILPEQTAPFKIGKYHLDRLQGMHVRDYEGDERHPFTMFAIVALALVVAATINFINISISQNVERSKEIVVRKINGANRYSIIRLFYIEVFIITVVSVVISFLLASLATDFFESALSIHINQAAFLNTRFILLTAAAVVLMVIVGGLYPVLVLSNVKPVPFLSAAFSQPSFARYTGQVVMVVQFGVSAALVMCVIVVNSQLRYVQKDDFGMNIENVLTFRMDQSDARSYNALQNDLLALTGVDNVGASDVGLFQDAPPITLLKRSDSSVAIPVSMMIVDSSFFSTLKTGKPSWGQARDGLILNEVAAKEFRIGRDIDKTSMEMGAQSIRISGIVDDFNFLNKKQHVGNLVMSIADDSSNVFSYTGCVVYVRISRQTASATLPEIRAIHERYFPDKVFHYDYLGDKIEAMYHAEHSMFRSFTLFTAIGILISLFGIIGLLMFNITRKMGGLSVRKLLGANTSQLSYFLSKEILRVTIMGAIIGMVVASYLLEDWLGTFAYKISISQFHILTCFTIILVSVLVVSAGFVRKAVNTDPVAFLRKE